eukprot:Rhum_TRINITY_DN14327_c1_g1::Rhum_TRINITY_DN14327_c1_g1_i1::g.80477::m.80477
MPPKKGGKPKVHKQYTGTAGPGGALREAAKEGDLTSVKALSVPHMIDDVDERGFTALHWAAWNGRTAVVDWLLKKGATVGHQDEDGQTALHHACWYGHHNCVILLLNEGADPNLPDGDGETAVGAAARSGSFDCMKALINVNADPRVRDKEGHNAVSRALKKGHQAIALLIEDYAKVYSSQGKGAAVDQVLQMGEANYLAQCDKQTYFQQYHTPQGAPAGHGGMPQYASPPPFASPGFGSPGLPQRPPSVHSSSTLHDAVSPLDDLQTQLQAKLVSPGGGGGPSSDAVERGTFDNLTVLTPAAVRLTGRAGLPPVGAAVVLDRTPGTLWSVVGVVKGGGAKLQAPPGSTVSLGEPGDDVGQGRWQTVPGQRALTAAPQVRSPAGYVGSPQPGHGAVSPPGMVASPDLATQQQQYANYQKHYQHLQRRPGPAQQQPQQLSRHSVSFMDSSLGDTIVPPRLPVSPPLFPAQQLPSHPPPSPAAAAAAA